MARAYEIRDPVHNFVLFDEAEKNLINSLPMQRLKRVKQLAVSREVYPGAVHSRFEHSLGTMELASEALDSIARKKPDAFGRLAWTDDYPMYRRLLRAGALLHDVGHAPFSHACEELLPQKEHEWYSAQMIHSEHIQPLLRSGPSVLDPDHVVAVALGPEKSQQEEPSLGLLQELVAGELGVDRMDYLARDALHTGATAGRFDYHRLLNTLTVIDHPDTGSPVLAVESGGLHAAEGLLFARYFMFQQVYFHKVARIYEAHLRQFLAEYLPGGTFPGDLAQLLELDRR